MALTNNKIGALEYLTAENISVPHGFTTRLGGVSQGHLSAINIGTRRGDSWENVLKNYEILGKAIGFDVKNCVLTKQTHTDIIRCVTENDAGTGLFQPDFAPCDGLVTNTPGLALVVFTADCTPVLLHDPVTGAVGAVHAGWKGTAQDIVGKAVDAMVSSFGADPGNVRAAIGPNIGQCCFQTDGDVPQALLETYGQAILPFIRQEDEKYYVNLKAVNAYALQRRGVTHIEISQECTRCDTDRFWSARFHRDARGSQGAIIVCKEADK